MCKASEKKGEDGLVNSSTFASAAREIPKECHLFIDGVWYDLSQFVTSHPGGIIIT